MKISNNFAGDIGTLKIKIVGKSLTSHEIELNKKEIIFNAGKMFTFFIASEDVGEVESAILNYDYSLSALRLYAEQLHVEFVTIETLESGRKIKICTKDGMHLKSYRDSQLKEEFC